VINPRVAAVFTTRRLAEANAFGMSCAGHKCCRCFGIGIRTYRRARLKGAVIRNIGHTAHINTSVLFAFAATAKFVPHGIFDSPLVPDTMVFVAAR
jgi:hypothetical protein